MALPGVFASVLRMKNASRPRSEKSLVRASTQNHLGISDVAWQKRHLFAPRGGVARQDALVATDARAHPNAEDAFAEWAMYREAKRKSGDKKAEGGG